MTIALALSVLVMVAGFCFYYWSSNVKIAEIGRISFLCGLLVSLLRLAGGATFSLFTK